MYGKGNENHQLGTEFFVHHIRVWTGKAVLFVCDRMPHIVLRRHYFNIIVLNVHATSEEKSDDSKETFYGELQQVFNHIPNYHIKIMLVDFNAKLGRVIFSNRQLGL